MDGIKAVGDSAAVVVGAAPPISMAGAALAIAASAAAAAASVAAGGGTQYVQALYDYPGAPQVLSMKRGELFTVIRKAGDWYTALNRQGKTGLLPSNYVQPYTGPTVAATDGKSAAANAGAAAPVTPSSGTATALYDYTSSIPQIPTFKRGDVFLVTGRSGEWLTVVDRTGTVGIVPANYVAVTSAASPVPPPAAAADAKSAAPAGGAAAAAAAGAGAGGSDSADPLLAAVAQLPPREQVQRIADAFERDAKYVELVTPARVLKGLMRYGWLRKWYPKTARHVAGTKPYAFFLFADALFLASQLKADAKPTAAAPNSAGGGPRFRLKSHVPLQGVAHVKPTAGRPGAPFAFQIHRSNAPHPVTVVCATAQERDEWAAAIDACVQQLHRPDAAGAAGAARAVSEAANSTAPSAPPLPPTASAPPAEVARNAPAPDGSAGAGGAADAMAAMQQQLHAMQQQIAAQQALIARLMPPPNGSAPAAAPAPAAAGTQSPASGATGAAGPPGGPAAAAAAGDEGSGADSDADCEQLSGP